MSDLLTDGIPDFLTRLRVANLARTSTRPGEDIDVLTPAEWAVNLAGEVGEALNVLKKMRRIQPWSFFSRTSPRHMMGQMAYASEQEYARLFDHFADELADAMICVDLLGASMGLDLATIVARKFNKTSEKWNSPVRLQP